MAHNLSTEIDAVKAAIDAGGYAADKDSAALLAGLKKIVSNAGFDATQSDLLDKLRTKVLRGSGVLAGLGVNANEGKRTLELCASYSGEKYATDDAAVKRVAALKTLRHTYMLGKAGARSIWVVNIPRDYRDWPSEELPGHATQERTMIEKLNKSREYFNGTHQRNMATGARDALRWVQKTLIVLGNHGKDKGQSATLVNRWFKTQDTTEEQLRTIVSDLTAGFKKIQAVLNSSQLIFSDYPPDRGTDDETSTEAFVFNGAWADKFKVVYIEKGFFAKGGNVLAGRDNWARIIVHELSHSQLGTEDYPKDNSYGWQGINPQDGKFNGNGAIRNAENWAYFAGDCAAALSKSEIATALKLP